MENTELLQSIQQIFESRFDSFEKRFNRMEADLSEVKDRIKNIELTLENDISKKLSAMHEGIC